MRLKTLSTMAAVSVLAGVLMTSQTAWADSSPTNSESASHSEAQGRTLVGLGDSITFGYGLSSASPTAPSPDAFPSLIANDENLHVDNLAVPGWTSQNLLSSLTTSRTMQRAVRHAKVITLDIGSNDLLSIAIADGLLTPGTNPQITVGEQLQFAAAIAQFNSNLSAILSEIRELSPRSTVVLYNIYDPISPGQQALFGLGEQLIDQENAIINLDATQFALPVADAYHAFAGNDAMYLLAGNVHPNKAGQRALATLGEQVLAEEHYHSKNWDDEDNQN